MSLPLNTILQVNALEVLMTFPSGSVDMVITSPPYWQKAGRTQLQDKCLLQSKRQSNSRLERF